MARTSIQARGYFKRNLPYRVTIFTIFGVSAAAIRIHGAVNMSAIPIKRRSNTVERVGGAWQLASRLVSSIIMTAIRTNSIRANGTLMFEHKGRFTIMRSTW